MPNQTLIVVQTRQTTVTPLATAESSQRWDSASFYLPQCTVVLRFTYLFITFSLHRLLYLVLSGFTIFKNPLMTGIDESDSALPIGTGPPTREEIRVHYPPKFTWEQLKLFINAG